jgi:antitoxin component of RelBE/YafQ-DinJ toxin-antitoxin module
MNTPTVQPPGEPNHEKESQINFRVPEALKKQFYLICDHQGISATEALTRLMFNYVTAGTANPSLHMDGSNCPLEKFISNLSEAVLVQTELRQSFNDAGLELHARNPVAKNRPQPGERPGADTVGAPKRHARNDRTVASHDHPPQRG